MRYETTFYIHYNKERRILTGRSAVTAHGRYASRVNASLVKARKLTRAEEVTMRMHRRRVDPIHVRF